MKTETEVRLNLEGRKPSPGTPKKYITPACTLCGWGPAEAIHNSPQLVRDGGFYHPFRV